MSRDPNSREAQDPLVGKILGGCLLEKRIGRGGMGNVYLAYRQADRKPLAIKILAPFLAEDQPVLTRFTREIRAASRVRNLNVVHVVGSSEENGVHFSLMEYIEGENLAEQLKREGSLSVGHAAFIAREVARGLAALHAEGILHRDVKPSNILIGSDHAVKITDFGIARDVFDRQRLTAPGDLLGTLGFAAPEQLERSEGDARADLYSLGATLHYMLSGARPPSNPRTPRSPLGDDVPEALRDLIDRLLSHDPASRPADAKSVAAALHPHARRPSVSSFRRSLLRGGLKVAGGLFAFWAGALATSSHGQDFRTEPWALVLPLRGSILPSGALFGSGILLAFLALVRGRERVGLGFRSIVGFSFLAGALVVAYMAGAAVGAVTLKEAALAIVSSTPEVLLAESITLAALGLIISRRSFGLLRVIGAASVLAAMGIAATASSGGSIMQAWEDTREAMSQRPWAWVALALAAVGVFLAYLQDGRPLQRTLAPVVVFISLGLVYWTSLGKGSPPLLDALSAPGGQIAVAVILAIGARAMLDIRSAPHTTSGGGTEVDTTTSSVTPTGS